MLFTVLKHIHVWCVTLSFGLFVVRAIWQVTHPSLLLKPIVRIAPHVVDTVLLATGLSLLFALGYNTAPPPWLIVKFFTLTLYIIFGIVCFRVPRLYKVALPLALGLFFTTAYLAVHKPYIW